MNPFFFIFEPKLQPYLRGAHTTDSVTQSMYPFYTENCQVPTNVMVITVQNGSHCHGISPAVVFDELYRLLVPREIKTKVLNLANVMGTQQVHRVRSNDRESVLETFLRQLCRTRGIYKLVPNSEFGRGRTLERHVFLYVRFYQVDDN